MVEFWSVGVRKRESEVVTQHGKLVVRFFGVVDLLAQTGCRSSRPVCHRWDEFEMFSKTFARYALFSVSLNS